MICFVQQLHPKSRGSVTLQSADPYDPPLIDPNYLSYQEEVDELVEGIHCFSISVFLFRKIGQHTKLRFLRFSTIKIQGKKRFDLT